MPEAMVAVPVKVRAVATMDPAVEVTVPPIHPPPYVREVLICEVLTVPVIALNGWEAAVDNMDE
jgi:hypothetical protein